MDNDRAELFKADLVRRGRLDGRDFADGTPDDQVIKIGLVEGNLQINFDNLSPNERLGVYASLAPTAANNHPNQLLMRWNERTPEGTITGIRNAIKNYSRYCGDSVEDY